MPDPSWTWRLATHAYDMDPDGHLPSENVPYDNTTSGLTADNVKDALDEVIAAAGPGGGGVPENYFYLEDYGAVGDGVTDDSQAFLDASGDLLAAGGGWICHRHRRYYMGDTLRDASVLNAILPLPQNLVSGTNPPIVFGILGNGPTGQWNHGTQGPWEPGNSGTMYITDWAGTISGKPAFIAASKHDAIYPAASFNWLEVVIRDLELRVPNNPKLSGIQMYGVASFSPENVTVSIDASSDNQVVCTNADATGIVMPAERNANQPCRMDNVFVDGFYDGYWINEVAYGGTISANHCVVGQRFHGPQNHASHFNRILNVACLTGMKFEGGNFFLTISHYDAEHSSGGKYARVYDVDDASNYGHGFIWWHTVLAGTGPDGDLSMNGGSNLIDICISNGVGWPGSGGAPTTADYLVGTSNGSLSAEIVVGTTPGGELGGTWATPTVDTTHSGSSHAGIISTHEADTSGAHVAQGVSITDSGGYFTATDVEGALQELGAGSGSSGGGIGPLLLASDHGGPIVFDDVIQASDFADLLYASEP